MTVIIWLNGPFGIGKSTTAQALLRRLPQAVLFDPDPFGAALRSTVANIETAADFQDLQAWPAVGIETARILRQAYAEILIDPLTVLKSSSAETLAAGLARVDPTLRRFRLVASEATLRARILQRPEMAGPHAWCLEHLEAGKALMADAAFGEAVPTDGRDPEEVANSILVRLATTRRAATDADRAFACSTHHLAYRDTVERQFGAWVEEQQDSFFQSSWAARPHEIVLFEGEPCGYVCIEDRPADVHLRELVLQPHYQCQGIGSAVLHAVIDHARARRVPVRLGTHLANRAANLYRRVGFRQIGSTNTHLLFEWTAANDTSIPGSESSGPDRLSAGGALCTKRGTRWASPQFKRGGVRRRVKLFGQSFLIEWRRLTASVGFGVVARSVNWSVIEPLGTGQDL